MRHRNDTPYDFQLTDDELEDLRRLGIPKILRPLLSGDASDVRKKTRAYRNLRDLARAEAEAKRWVLTDMEADRELDQINGDEQDKAKLRRQLAAANIERDRALADLRKERSLREIQTARPAIAVHAQGSNP